MKIIVVSGILWLVFILLLLFHSQISDLRSPTQTANFTLPAKSVDQVRQEIEQKFGIEIKTEKEIYQTMDKPLTPDMTSFATIMSVEDLNTISSSLIKLPAYFHQPDPNGKPLLITLFNKDDPNRPEYAPNEFCITFTCTETDETRVSLEKNPRSDPLYRHHIQLAFISGPEAAEWNFMTVTHELTHRITSGYIEEIKQGKRPNYFQEVESILGGNFFLKSGELDQSFKAKYPQLLEAAEETHDPDKVNELESFYSLLHYGLTDDIIPSEFTSVLAENYVRGKSYFYYYYGLFFPSDEVDRFYNFIKQDIFQGREY